MHFAHGSEVKIKGHTSRGPLGCSIVYLKSIPWVKRMRKKNIYKVHSKDSHSLDIDVNPSTTAGLSLVIHFPILLHWEF